MLLVLVVMTLLIVVGSSAERTKDIYDVKEVDIVWLHIPKCGTSFLNTLYHYACAGIPPSASVGTNVDPEHQEEDLTVTYPMARHCPDGFIRFGIFVRGHDPLYDNTKIENVVAMFREPFDRLVSGFNYNRHMDGKSGKEMKMIENAVKGKSRETQLEIYIRLGDLLGCQTKMVVGHRCATNYTLTQADLEKAKQRVDRMKFVGITNQWTRSICLFHRMLGGQIYDVEFQNQRAGHYNREEFHRVKDIFDDELFRHVNKLVNRRFVEYGC